jgi:BlaI family transcriptional regulator, penicillinase repressor
MPRKPQDVTDAELAVLEALWARGPQTIRQLSEIVYPQDSERQYSTVKRLLSRLESKNVVRRCGDAIPLVFEAAIGRDDLIGRRLEALAKALCPGSVAPLLMHAAQSDNLTDRQRRTLLDLIDELDGGSADNTGQ